MLAILLSLLLATLFHPSSEASAADTGTVASDRSFYAGKTVKVFVGFQRGVAYDLYARLTANHLSRHISGSPALVVENRDRKSTRLNSSHIQKSRMPSSA